MMKRVGILGGMSWESTLEYYRIMNEYTKERIGKKHSANCLTYSFDFHLVEQLQHENKWDQLTELMVAEAINLKKAKADFIVIATNTMHRMVPQIEEATKLSVLHIADATGDAILQKGINKILLLGTKFTMEGDFYKDRLEAKGIDVIIPDDHDRNIIHNIIYDELILGNFKASCKAKYQAIIEKYGKLGAQGVVLGCTEIPLLIKDDDVSIEVFDTTTIHAKAAIDHAINSI